MKNLLCRPISAVRASKVAFRPAFVAPVRAPVAQRGILVVVAADADKDKKPQKKRTPFPVKRTQLAQKRRMYNKARKSACATRIKKVIKMAESMVTSVSKSDEDIKGLEKLISEAFCEIDKAVIKGVLHKNNGARKKARCSRYKKKVLLAAGLWTPPAEHPDYRLYMKLQAKKPAAATTTA